MHEVQVLCFCEDIEHCTMERYIADVRIAYTEIEELRLKSSKAWDVPRSAEHAA